jgi:hypothetical protein
MTATQLTTLVAGLLFAGWSWAILNDWRGAGNSWERLDAMFPSPVQTPAAVAGPSLMVLGWTATLVPLLLG